MEYFSKYAGETNKVARRHEKNYIKSLFKGFVKDPFESSDWKKQDRDVRRYESTSFVLANEKDQRKYQRALVKEEAREHRAFDRITRHDW